MTDDNPLYSILRTLRNRRNFIFLWTGKKDKENHRSLIFINPCEVISAYKHDKIKDCFLRIEDKLTKGYYVAGYLSYEAGSAFEDTLPKINTGDFPLLWFGVYKKPMAIARPPAKSPQFAPYRIYNLKMTEDKRQYLADISKIKAYIKKGDTYQVNYTFKYKFGFKGSASGLFYDLNARQSVPFAAYIGFGGKKILSLSPELFFSRKGGVMKVKPMKGTIERGVNTEDDKIKENALKNSLKDRAENVMIVDMLRNDLGRISKSGSVKTIRLFETEKYQTLFQMTSTVTSTLKAPCNWYDIFKAIFPSGSVTGAPKIRTMQIINELENAPRNIYTGAIGYISPEKKAVFNVAIRTILLDEAKRQGEMGIGSGITISSDPETELAECKLKADFFVKKYRDFKLIETMLWQKGKFFLLGLHLKRLKCSACYFDFKYRREYLLKSLKRHSVLFDKNKNYRIRMLLSRNGAAVITSSALDGYAPAAKITFSKIKTISQDVFLYHKTTNRKIYDDEYKKYKKRGFIDAIFLNEKDEVTEGSISNIIIRNEKHHYTPPICCGLLNGVYRQYLLNKRHFSLKEKILYKEDIIKAKKVYICNSVRGLVNVSLGNS